jgi:cobalamin biosynthesis protein CbiD
MICPPRDRWSPVRVLGTCACALSLAACGTSDQAKVERAIKLRQPDRVIHSVACRRLSGRAWRCVLRTDSAGDIDHGQVTEVCNIEVGSDAGKIEHYLCTG